MYHFIMGKRQHEVFAVLVHHPEGHFVVVVLAINRVELHISEGVIHPAHIPFEIETQTAVFAWVGYTSKRSGLFRNRNRTCHFTVNFPVGVF